jgi:hypothetical protein
MIGAVVQNFSNVMSGGAENLYAAFIDLLVRLCANEVRNRCFFCPSPLKVRFSIPGGAAIFAVLLSSCRRIKSRKQSRRICK